MLMRYKLYYVHVPRVPAIAPCAMMPEASYNMTTYNITCHYRNVSKRMALDDGRAVGGSAPNVLAVRLEALR
jgi:hypothetical protein